MRLRGGGCLGVLLVIAGLLALLAVGPATAVSVTCAPATGIVNADGEGWTLSNSNTIQQFDSEWNRSDSTGMVGARGIERGPDGALWRLTSDRVVRLDERGDPQVNISLADSLTNGSTPKDLVYAGTWLVLSDRTVLAYDDGWENGTVLTNLSARLPDHTTGMTAMNDSLAAVSRNGTIHVYDSPTNGSIDRRRSFSANVTDSAVDIHHESNDRWLVLEPHDVTTVTGDGERLAQHPIFTSCSSGGVNILLTMLGFAAIGAVVLLSLGVVVGIVVVVTVRTVRYVRR